LNPRIFLLICAPILLLSAAYSLWTGQFRWKVTLAERSNDPIMFWVYVSLEIAAAGLLAAYGFALLK
jgi:hypothetical protein